MAHKSDRIIDEIQIKMADGKISSCLYFDDTKKPNKDNIRFINENDILTELNNHGKILFMTSKEGENVEFAYGYKLKPMSVECEDFKKLLLFYDEKSRDKIAYFAQRISVGDFYNEGVFFVGDELRKNKDRIKKIYFKCILENHENGDELKDEKVINELIDGSSIKELSLIRDKTRFLLDHGFFYDMIAWNESSSNQVIGYKLYYIGKEYSFKDLVIALLDKTEVSYDSNKIEDALKSVNGLYLAHISYCIDTNNNKELNFYFKGIKDGKIPR